MQPLANRGIFITLEGGEGSGKSTLMELLHESLLARRIPCTLTREPGGGLSSDSPICQTLRRLLLEKERESGKMAPATELLLFLAARAQNLMETIEPALRRGHCVLCDRFSDSTVAYQGGARNLTKRRVQLLSELAGIAREPDLTLLLDVDPAIGLARSKLSDTPSDRLESETLAFHRRVRQEYRALARDHPERIALIDAEKSLQHISQVALERVLERFSTLDKSS